MQKLFSFRAGLAALALAISSCSSHSSSQTKIEAIPSENGTEKRFQSVVGQKGMVVSDDRAASEWGAEVLKKGGNAIDAAVATAFALSVSRPHLASLGGGGFLVYCPAPPKKLKCIFIDYREKAPLSVNEDTFKRKGKIDRALSKTGALASGVPGVVSGLLMALEKYGTLSRDKILKRPIEMAEKGVPQTPLMEEDLIDNFKNLSGDTLKIFGCNSVSKPCTAGSKLLQPELAKVLKEVARTGEKGFYEGHVARDLVREIQVAGGIITLDDLKKYQAKERVPLEFNWKGYHLITASLPSAGGLILKELTYFSDLSENKNRFNDGPFSTASIHANVQAMNLAFRDRTKLWGDPDFKTQNVEAALSDKRLDSLYNDNFDAQKKVLLSDDSKDLNVDVFHQTTHLSVVDAEGGAVALTTTLNSRFGSHFTVPGLGIVMNNEMDDFNLEAATTHPNALAPEKKPLSSMTPTIVKDSKGAVRFVLGAQGGTRIPTTVFLTLFYRIVGGLNIADAVFAPRFHSQWKPDLLRLEPFGYSKETQKALANLGYKIEFGQATGFEQVIERGDERVYGVSDPRTEGAAVAESLEK